MHFVSVCVCVCVCVYTGTLDGELALSAFFSCLRCHTAGSASLSFPLHHPGSQLPLPGPEGNPVLVNLHLSLQFSFLCFMLSLEAPARHEANTRMAGVCVQMEPR